MDEARLFILVLDGIMRDNDDRLKQDKVRLYMKKIFPKIEDCQTLEQFIHRICEIPILGWVSRCD